MTLADLETLTALINDARNAGHGTAERTALWIHAVVQAPLLDRIAELEAERDDLADELDNVRSAFRDRWAAFGSKGGE